MPQKLIDQTTIQPDGRPGDDAFTAFATCNDNFEDAEQRLSALEGGSSNIGQDVADLKTGLQQEQEIRLHADDALGLRIDAEQVARQALAEALGARFIGKNYIINGDFRFQLWQRAVSQAELDTNFTPRYLAADRWYIASKATKIGTGRQAFPPGQTEVPGNPRHYARFSTNSGLTAESMGYFGQCIEGVGTFAGETVTLSFYARGNTSAKLGVAFVQHFGVGGSPDNGDIVAGAVNVTTAWTRFTVTLGIPSISGKTIGSANDHLRLRFWMDAGANYAGISGGLGFQTWYVDIANVQIERGSVATTFEYRPDALELALCQRYYEKSYNLASAPGTAERNGAFVSTLSTVYLFAAPKVSFVVPKRSIPAVAIYSTQDGAVASYAENNAGGVHVTNRPAIVTYTSTTGFEIQTNGSGQAGNIGRAHWTADAEL